MKKYKVTLYFHSSIDIEVEAENESEAIECARDKSCSKDISEMILDWLEEDNAPDVYEIE